VVRRSGLFTAILLFCGPLIVLSSFLVWMSPLGLGFSAEAGARLKSPLVMTAYWATFLSGPIAVFGMLPLSASMSIYERTRKLGFQILIVTTVLLIPAQLFFLLWLSS